MKGWSVWYWIVCIYAVLFLCLGFKACGYVKEARGAEPTELSFTDKAKIAGGCCLFWLFSPSNDKERIVVEDTITETDDKVTTERRTTREVEKK